MHPEPVRESVHRECRKENVPGDHGSSQQQNYEKKGQKCKKSRTCMITGGVELVPLLAKRRAAQRPISLSTTDVTKYPDDNKKYVWNL